VKLESLEQLYLNELADIQDAEKQLIKALPRLAKAANSPELQAALEDHLGETEVQSQRLEEIISRLSTAPKAKTCEGMKGLIKEGEEAIKADGDPSVRDAALIAAAQRVEHYEMAGYGCARTFAELLGDDAAAAQLQKSLDEESSADRKLTRLAREVVNVQAQSA